MDTLAEKENIIIVDDNIDNLRVLTEILTGYGYNVRPAINGSFALISSPALGTSSHSHGPFVNSLIISLSE